jgi:hypothetical protein
VALLAARGRPVTVFALGFLLKEANFDEKENTPQCSNGFCEN